MTITIDEIKRQLCLATAGDCGFPAIDRYCNFILNSPNDRQCEKCVLCVGDDGRHEASLDAKFNEAIKNEAVFTISLEENNDG